MASIRPPTGGPPRPAAPMGPRRPEPGAAPSSPAPAPRSAPAQGTARTADLYRAETTMPVERLRQADPALRTPGTSAGDRAVRRSETLAKATGGSVETFDPGAEKIEEPIEASTAIRDQGGRLLTPQIDAWIRVVEAGGVAPPSARGVASELCGLADADAMSYAGVLHRVAGEPMGAFLRGLGKIEMKSFLRLLEPDARDGLIGSWASALKKRLGRPAAPPAMAAEIVGVTYASPRLFGRLLEKADTEALRTALGALSPQARQELFAVVPQKVLRAAAGPLRGLVPASAGEEAKPRAEKREAAEPTAQTDELQTQMTALLGAARAGQAPAAASPQARSLQGLLGRELLEGGVPSWRRLGEALGETAAGGFRGAHAAALLLRLALEGLREAARQAPRDASASVLQIPFSLAGKLGGAAGAVFKALGRNCSDEFAVYVDGRGLWRQLVGQALDALRAEAGDSEAAKAWRAEAG